MVEEAGMKPVEVAGFLGVSKAAVSRYLSEEPAKSRDPSKHVLELFRRKLAERSGTAVKYAPQKERIAGVETPAVREVADQISELHEHDPESFEVVKNLTYSLAKKARAAKTKKAAPSKKAATTVEPARREVAPRGAQKGKRPPIHIPHTLPHE